MRYLLTNLPLELGEEKQPLDASWPAPWAAAPTIPRSPAWSGSAWTPGTRAPSASWRPWPSAPARAVAGPAAAARRQAGADAPEPVSWPWSRARRPAPGGDRGQRPGRHLLRPAPAGLRHRAGACWSAARPWPSGCGRWPGSGATASWTPTPTPSSAKAGAGTFSDGKLTTRIGHPAIRYVLETFVALRRHPRVLYLARPHVGTDVIRKCSVLIRKDAEARGARYRFRARLADIRFRDGAVAAAVLDIGRGDPLRRPGAGPRAQRPGHLRDAAPATASPCARSPSPWACGWSTPRTSSTAPSTAPSPGPPQPGPGRLQAGVQPRPGPGRLLLLHVPRRRGDPVRLGAGRGGGERHEQRQAGFRLRQFGPGGQGQHRRLRLRAPAGRACTSSASGSRPRSAPPGRPTAPRPPASRISCAGRATRQAARHQLPPLRRARRHHHLPARVRAGAAARRHPRLRPQAARLHQPPGPAAGHRKPHQQPGAAAARRGRARASATPGSTPAAKAPGSPAGITSAAVDGIRVAEWIAQKGGAPAFLPFQRNVKAGEYATE